MKHLLPIVLLLSLSGCKQYVLPDGMEVTERLYADSMKLAVVCGVPRSCVETDFINYCHMHLRVAWNGGPVRREHERSHCGGLRHPQDWKEQ